ncbi:MAG: UDP-N-acetylmuramoyl-tripeptide--D-alanyl-D-alanine ligase, partial [Lachnospiraceae bacterium]|nr:UDP-N-acetylmuramoyl-tripeptide--D-alanyl-D-alanine ligase [Lachnospiraceae bacterium]
LKKEGIAVVNGDDDLLSKLDESRVFGHRIYKYGMKEDALDAKAVNVKNHGLKGSDFDVKLIRDGKEKTIKSLHTPLPGDHMVMNGVCAALIGDLLGLSEDEIRQGLRENKGMAGRSNIINTGKFTIIDDCYNANPASTEAALDLLKLADTRKVAILGDMYELGEGERQMHAEVGEYAVKTGVDMLISIGEISVAMKEGAEKAGGSTEIHYFKDIESFFEKKDELLKENDSILVKASHGMDFARIVEELKK